MTFTVAFILLAIGIAIGFRAAGLTAKLKAWYWRRTYKPAMLRPFVPHGAPDATPAHAPSSVES
jgi:hypothetical protein